MSNLQNKIPKEIILIWIGKQNSTNTEEFHDWKEEITKIKENINFIAFEDINQGLNELKEIKFQQTILILNRDSNLCENFFVQLSQYSKRLFVCSKIIMFTKKRRS
jgi:hypothetical protein